MKKTIQFGAAALVLMMTAAAGAQDKPAAAAQDKPAATAQEKPQAMVPTWGLPVKIQLVLSRFQGEKKLSSVPYMLWVTTNESRTSLRMGVKLPVYSGGGATSSYNYTDVGTNIDCGVTGARDGAFKVNLTITDSSVYFPNSDRPTSGVPPSSDTAPPTFRSFNSTFSILLRDGQTGQYTSVTDPVSGEVLKIDATLNVLK